MSGQKRILIIAGPNGADKTTFATEFLPNEANCRIFINADLIAAGVSPFQPSRVEIRAGRLMLSEIRVHAQKGDTFAFETMLSGRGYARRIPRWQAQDYRVKLFFLKLPTPEAAIRRVALRVAQGGRGVPETIIRRIFHTGWQNFERIYRHLVNEWALYDNSGKIPVLLEEETKQ